MQLIVIHVHFIQSINTAVNTGSSPDCLFLKISKNAQSIIKLEFAIHREKLSKDGWHFQKEIENFHFGFKFGIFLEYGLVHIPNDQKARILNDEVTALVLERIS